MAEAGKRLRVMADTNVLIAGILFPRWFHEFLRHALKGDFKLVLCEQRQGSYGSGRDNGCSAAEDPAHHGWPFSQGSHGLAERRVGENQKAPLE